MFNGPDLKMRFSPQYFVYINVEQNGHEVNKQTASFQRWFLAKSHVEFRQLFPIVPIIDSNR